MADVLKSSRGLHAIAVTLVLAVLTIGTLLEGYSQSFMTCKVNCGETFDALAHVDDYRANGLKYGLIEVIAASDNPDIRPVLYTHNVNLGGIVFALLDALGFTSITAKQMVTLCAFIGGLIYIYRTMVLFTQSRLAGLIVLLLFATDIEHVLSFSFNALRAWHWLALFGVLYHASQIARDPAKPLLGHRIGLVLMAALAFGIGYDFLAISIAVAMCAMILLVPRRLSLLHYAGLLVWFGIAFLVPVALRQLQIISVLGFDFWRTDLYYSAVIKVNLLSKILPLPPIEQIEQFYAAERVLRPPATPATSLESILITARDLVMAVTVPSIGMVTALLSMGVGAVSVVVAVATAVRGWRGKPPLAPTTAGANSEFRAFGIGAAQLISILLVGSLVGLTPFAPLSLHIYLKHQFPLVAAPLIVTKAVVLTALLLIAARSFRISPATLRARATSFACLGMVLLILGDHLLIQTESKRVLPTVDMAWTRFVSARPDAAFVVSGMPPSWVEPFSEGQVGFLPMEKDIELLQLMRAGRPADEIRRTPAIAAADYWLYAPADFTTSFDKLTSECRSDLLLSAVGRVAVPGVVSPPKLALKGVWPTVVAPGGTISIVAEFDRALPPNSSVVVAFGDEPPPEARPSPPPTSGPAPDRLNPTDPARFQTLEYNCPRHLVQGRFNVPLDIGAGLQQMLISVKGPDGLQIVNTQSYVTINPSEPPSSIPPLRIPVVPPGVEEMVATGVLKVAQRGAGYVVFDLRQ